MTYDGASPPAEEFDLSARRSERQAMRAARREGRGDTLTIRDGGVQIAVLGPEFPLDVLEPLEAVNLDIALLLQQAAQLTMSQDQTEQAAAMEMTANILAANPRLFTELINAIKEMGRRLLGAAGYDAFIATRPTPWDVYDLGKRLYDWYGVNLGESLRSSEPATDGGTSQQISSTTTRSMPEESGNPPASPDSSGPDGSSR